MTKISCRAFQIMLTLSLFVSIIASSGAITTAQADGPGDMALTPHSTIRVNNDTELAALKTTGDCTGSGTAADPYVIEGYDITGSGGICIFIGNTTSHSYHQKLLSPQCELGSLSLQRRRGRVAIQCYQCGLAEQQLQRQ